MHKRMRCKAHREFQHRSNPGCEDLKFICNAADRLLGAPSEFERIFQRRSLIEHKMLRSGVRILEEVANALELNRKPGIVLKKRRLGKA